METALTLYGKVTYFWGGKSLVLGWDSRWGQLAKVTAAGSPTTGTYRPYGLDCSGMVDWVFYNVTGGEYVIGHGGEPMPNTPTATRFHGTKHSLAIWSFTRTMNTLASSAEETRATGCW